MGQEESISASVAASDMTAPNSIFDLGVDSILPEPSSWRRNDHKTEGLLLVELNHGLALPGNPIRGFFIQRFGLNVLSRPSSVTQSMDLLDRQSWKFLWRARPMRSINEASEGEEDQYNPYFGERYYTSHPLGTASLPRIVRSLSLALQPGPCQAPWGVGMNHPSRTIHIVL